MVTKYYFYFQLPEATTILGLALPHFILGLGIGIIDSALMPLLATLVDEEEHGKAYGSVYAIGTFIYYVSSCRWERGVRKRQFIDILICIPKFDKGFSNLAYFLEFTHQ